MDNRRTGALIPGENRFYSVNRPQLAGEGFSAQGCQSPRFHRTIPATRQWTFTGRGGPNETHELKTDPDAKFSNASRKALFSRRLSCRFSMRPVQPFMAAGAEGNQVQIGI
jgi:hypothetical protein